MLPRERYSHTSELVHFEALSGRRCLIVGGRQSAFESAALMQKRGVTEVHAVYRHDTPRFAAADWSFVDPLMDRTLATPGWFRGLPAED